MEKILSLVASIVERVEVNARWVVIIGITLFAWLNYAIYELISHGVQFSGISDKIFLLERLGDVASKNSFSTNALKPFYLSIIEDLENPWSFSKVAQALIIDPVVLIKGLTASSVWIAIAIWTIISLPAREDLLPKLRDLLILVIITFVVGAFVPVIYAPQVNYFLFPLVQVVLLLILVRKT